MTENESIDWPSFESKFYKLEPGKQAEVLLTGWRQRDRTFGDNETPRTALVFDVVNVDGQTFAPPKEWATTSPGLVFEFRPMIERAVAQGRRAIKVILKRTTDKKYIVIDISERDRPTKAYPGLKPPQEAGL